MAAAVSARVININTSHVIGFKMKSPILYHAMTLVLLPMIVLFVRTYKKARRNRAQGKTATVQGVATLTSLSFQLFSFLLSAIDQNWYKMVYWSFYASVLILANGSENG